jgi:Na+/phosphate symporter
MLGALLVFLIGCLVLAVVIYVLHMVLDMITLPPQVKQIALVIIGLIGLVVVLILAVNVFRGGGTAISL